MGRKNKTVLFVMPRMPFPATSGRKTSLYHYCKILSENLGYRLVVAAFMEDGDSLKNVPNFIDRLIVLPSPSVYKKIRNVLFKSIIKKELPLQVALYWNSEADRVIKKIFNEENPFMVIGDMVRSTEYIKDLECIRIADLDDRISLRYARQFDTDFEMINPYGAYLNTLPSVIQSFLLNKRIKRYVFSNEIELLKAYELEIGRKFEKTIFVAKNEANQFNNEIGELKAVAVPIGVDTRYFEVQDNSIEKENIIGFLGAMNVSHNEYAVIHFIKDIMPIIKKRVKNVKFLVIGGGVGAKLRSFENDSVIFTGRVDDVREYLSKCKVFVCPMTFGSGIKTKNLEALSMGLPVVTTSIGAENITANSDNIWKVADENTLFADEVINILTDEKIAKELSENGRRYIEKNWTWDVACNCFKNLFEEFL